MSMAVDAPQVATARDGDSLTVSLTGAWTTQRIGPAQAKLSGIAITGARRARIDLGGLAALDTAGAMLLHQTLRHFREAGLEATVDGADATAASLIETAGKFDRQHPPPPPRDNPIAAILLRLGRSTFEVGRAARDLLNFLGLTVIVLLGSLLRPGRIRGTALISQMEQTGLNALPIVGLISFLIGVVLAYQGADQLARFGAQIFTVNLVAVGVLREMGILLTAIIVAGRSGSAFTAQIGTMKVNEEIDAMRTIGLDPMEVLVMPRVIGLMLVLPLLTFYADIMGLLGGAMMATLTLDISFVRFARQVSEAVTLWSFWIGIIKAPIFAFIIALVGCYEGLMVTRSAESVGRQTTRAVVEAIFLVIVLDAVFSILFSIIGI
ncbi:MAG: MlaE family lipid ABC transporter permease subunit [Alphaproteobacteria bacterium]